MWALTACQHACFVFHTTLWTDQLTFSLKFVLFLREVTSVFHIAFFVEWIYSLVYYCVSWLLNGCLYTPKAIFEGLGITLIGPVLCFAFVFLLSFVLKQIAHNLIITDSKIN